MSNKKKSSKKIIRVEITESTPSDFYIAHLEDFETKDLDSEDFQYRLNVQYSTQNAKKLFRLELKLDAFFKNEDISESGVFGITSNSVFKVKDFDKIVDKNDELIAPEKFIKKLLNICIGGVRGMLSSNLIGTNLSHITLPLFDLKPKD